MKLTIKQCDFLFNLLKSYKNTLYLEMRKQNYLMNNILQFISGYEFMCDWISYSLTNAKREAVGMNICYTPPFSDYGIILFENEDDAVNFITSMISIVNRLDYSKWTIAGMKYTLCLAKYYLKFVLTGKDTEVPEYLYIELPDKNNPEEYDWEEKGIKFDT